MFLFSRRYAAAMTALVLGLTLTASFVPAAETGPIQRRWGLGWDRGLTARLWLGGTWEMAVLAGPSDYLNRRQEYRFDSGWSPREENSSSEEKEEAGFVQVQAGRLVTRRGPLAAVCYAGLGYDWSDARTGTDQRSIEAQENSMVRIRHYDRSTWTLTLGLRPSWEVLDFLTLETAFGLAYTWRKSEENDRYEYPETGELRVRSDSSRGNSFTYWGWYGLGSLQFIVWF